MEKGKSYLVSYENSKKKKVVDEIKVLESTTTCYKIEFKSFLYGLSMNEKEWITKDDFYEKYLVLEEYEKNEVESVYETMTTEELFSQRIPPPLPEPPPDRILKEGKRPPKPPKSKSWRSV